VPLPSRGQRRVTPRSPVRFCLEAWTFYFLRQFNSPTARGWGYQLRLLGVERLSMQLAQAFIPPSTVRFAPVM
jgi:hypothetical protein